MVQTIQDSIASGNYTSDSTVAIVYRTNAQSRAIEEACVQANLPYVVRGSSGAFYKRAEIQDCLCFLRLLRNGRDEAAMKRAIKTPSRGIGNVAYDEFARYCEKVEEFYRSKYPDRPSPTPFDVLISLSDDQNSNDASGVISDAPSPLDSMSKRALNRFVPFSKQMRLIQRKAQSLTVAGLLSSIISDLKLRSHIDSISKSTSEFSDRWNNVIELRRAAQRYSDDGASVKNLQENDDDSGTEPPAETPLGNFLDDVALVTDMADDATDSDGPDQRLVVNLMTIHASKGMEFDAVFLIGNEDGTLPSRMAIMEDEGSVALDEEKRLCYVAMTRAKTHLVMTWRREVSIFNGNTFTSVNASRSRFLDILVGKNGKTSKGSKKNAKSNGLPRQAGPGGRVGAQRSSLPRAGTTNTFPRPSGTHRRDLTTAPPQRTRNIERAQAPGKQGADRSRNEAGTLRKKQPQEMQVRAILQPKPRNGYSSATRSPATKATNGRRSSTNITAKKQKTVSTVSSSDTMDSTWFYPVGSSVVHKLHGNGMVLPPPLSQREMLVRVQFEDGSKHDFPVDGKDLHLY